MTHLAFVNCDAWFDPHAETGARCWLEQITEEEARTTGLVGGPMNDAELMREAIRVSGRSSSKFALTILARDARSVRRWKAGAKYLKPCGSS